MTGVGLEAGGDHAVGHLDARVDAHVATHRLGCVVLVAEHPVDLLRVPGGHGAGERAAGPQHALGSHHFTRAEPAFEEIEEMNSVLDEDAAAFLRIPEPMILA